MTPMTSATLTAALLAALATGVYALACWVAPFVTCRRCQGTGSRALSFRRLRACRRCGGAGTRLRAGRKLYNHARAIHRAATTTTMPAPPRDPNNPRRPTW